MQYFRVAGLLVGIPVMKNIKQEPWETPLFYISIILYLVLMICVVLINCFVDDYPETDWRSCCPDPIISQPEVE